MDIRYSVSALAIYALMGSVHARAGSDYRVARSQLLVGSSGRALHAWDPGWVHDVEREADSLDYVATADGDCRDTAAPAGRYG